MKKLIKKTLVPAALLAGLLIVPTLAFAQEIVPSQSLGKVDDIISVVRNIIRFILIVAFVLAFLFLIVGGIRWITAGGDEKGVAGARGMITGALIGLVIVLVAFALIRLVETFFGFDIIGTGVTIPKVSDAPGTL